MLLKLDHEVAKIIHEWRQVSHALQQVSSTLIFQLKRSNKVTVFTYSTSILQILPFSQAQNPKTGRIHGTYSHFTITGRLIMAEPSLQFIQRNFDLSISFSRAEVETLRSECAKFGSKVTPLLSTVVEGLRLEAENAFTFDSVKSISMRNAFRASSSNFYLVAADYSQLELRVLAILCKDAQLCHTLNSGKDVFKSIASEWKKIPLDQVLRVTCALICSFLWMFGKFSVMLPGGHSAETRSQEHSVRHNLRHGIEVIRGKDGH